MKKTEIMVAIGVLSFLSSILIVGIITIKGLLGG